MGRDMNQQYNNEENLAKAPQHHSQQASELAKDESYYTDKSNYLNLNVLTEDDTIRIGGFSILFWVIVAALCLLVGAIVWQWKTLVSYATRGKNWVTSFFPDKTPEPAGA